MLDFVLLKAVSQTTSGFKANSLDQKTIEEMAIDTYGFRALTTRGICKGVLSAKEA